MNKYHVILADPNWFYNNRKTGGERCNKTKFGGGAQKHYPLLKAHEIIDPAITYDVPAMAAENSILFMWVTMPLMYDSLRRRASWKPTSKWKAPHDAFTVLDAWGFRYTTTGFVWIKTSAKTGKLIYGPGYYTASNAEICIIGIKGKMAPAKKMMPSIIQYPRMEHSRKPNIHPYIDLMYPNSAKVELFARRTYPGWKTLGPEINKEGGNDVFLNLVYAI